MTALCCPFGRIEMIADLCEACAYCHLGVMPDFGDTVLTSLLLVTCGDSDLQVVVPGNEGDCLVRLGPDTQRAIHERLLSGQLAYEMRADAARLPNCGNRKLWESEGKLTIGDSPETAIDHVLPDDKLPLVPVKLAGIERLFRNRPVQEKPDTIVVFNTRRTHRRDEPIAAGRILARWLAEIFGLRLVTHGEDFQAGTALALDYIDDTVPADSDRGRSVNPAAVQRIDDILSRVPPDSVRGVTFSLNGGIPAYRDQIRACARFRFEDARFYDCLRANDPENGLVTAQTRMLLPSDSFHARREVRRLVRTGDFHGASVVASQFVDQRDEKPWAVATRRAFRFLDGQLQTGVTVAGLPKAFADDQPPRCLLAAFRAEAALRAGRVLEAVLWSSTFPDAAYIDLLERLEFVAGVDEIQRRLFPREGHKFPARLIGAAGSGKPIIIDGPNHVYLNSHPQRERFYPFFPRRAARALREYHKALGTEVSARVARGPQNRTPRIRLRQIRNVISHGALPADTTNWVIQSFRNAGIWRDAEPFLLGNDHVRDLIASITGHDPGAIYEGLVEGLCAQLGAHRYS